MFLFFKLKGLVQKWRNQTERKCSLLVAIWTNQKHRTFIHKSKVHTVTYHVLKSSFNFKPNSKLIQEEYRSWSYVAYKNVVKSVLHQNFVVIICPIADVTNRVYIKRLYTGPSRRFYKPLLNMKQFKNTRLQVCDS